MTYEEKRNRHRLQTRQLVSLKCLDHCLINSSWHVGEIVEVSAEGMRIYSETIEEMPPHSDFRLLCFPEEEWFPYAGREPEPVWLKGRLIWQDVQNYLLGMTYRQDILDGF